MQCAEISYSKPLRIVLFPNEKKKNIDTRHSKGNIFLTITKLTNFDTLNLIKFSTLNHITIVVLSTQKIRTLVHVLF